MNGQIQVKIYDNTYQIEKGTTISELLKSINYQSKYKILLAKVDNTYQELDYNILRDCDIELVDLTSKEGNKSMISLLVFILIASIKDIYGMDKDVCVDHSLDKGLYIETNFNITEEDILKIKERMHKYIEESHEIKRVNVDRLDAMKYYRSINDLSKVENLKYNTNRYISLYKLDNYYDYFYTLMPNNTNLISDFDLTYIDNSSLVLNFNTIYSPDVVPKYTHHNNMFKVFRDCKDWAKLMNLENASDLNRVVSEGHIDDIIRMCENKLSSEFLQLASNIVNEDKKIVLMAGPSSSGKTTSSNKLCLALRALGKKPIVISMDDYFVDREFTPVLENGEKDYECLEAVDLDLFDKQIKSLLNNESVVIPTYNFVDGKKEFKNEIKMEDGAIIVIEGIHALDNKVLVNIDRNIKYKIYVSALTELNIDNHNRISTTDNRLLRRIIRDSRTRGHSISDTLASWHSVREGEEKYIFPYQDDNDYVLNTALHYEMGVLKTYVEPLLYSVDTDSIYYDEAKRLINLLKNFLPIPSDAINKDSIIREFIGGSCYLD